MFWRRKRKKPLSDEGVPAPPSDLVAIRVYTTADVVNGWTHLGQQRLSDLLNNEQGLSISRVAERPTEADWQRMDRRRMVLVVAPPHVSPRQLRVNRNPRPITAHTDHYAVRGVVHFIPGNRIDRTLLRTRQPFVPVTDARVSTRDEPEREERHDVVLLNVAYAADGLKLELIE